MFEKVRDWEIMAMQVKGSLFSGDRSFSQADFLSQQQQESEKLRLFCSCEKKSDALFLSKGWGRVKICVYAHMYI